MYWSLGVYVNGLTNFKRTVRLPGGAGPFDFDQLVDVDPTTALADPNTEAAAVYLAEIQDAADRAEAAIGATGPTGPSGVIGVTTPITNSGTSTAAQLGIDQTALTVGQSQVTNLVTDLVARVLTEVQLSNMHQGTNTLDVMPRNISSANIAYTSGVALWTYFTPLKTITVSQVAMRTQTSAGSSLTLARMGLYTVAANSDITLVARTANDTTLFTAINTIYTRSFDTTGGYPSTYTLVAGQRYAFGFVVTGTTMPSFSGANIQGTIAGLSPKILSSRGGQTDLPISLTAAQDTGSGSTFFARFS
jgi:hypothetical protein